MATILPWRCARIAAAAAWMACARVNQCERM